MPKYILVTHPSIKDDRVQRVLSHFGVNTFKRESDKSVSIETTEDVVNKLRTRPEFISIDLVASKSPPKIEKIESPKLIEVPEVSINVYEQEPPATVVKEEKPVVVSVKKEQPKQEKSVKEQPKVIKQPVKEVATPEIEKVVPKPPVEDVIPPKIQEPVIEKTPKLAVEPEHVASAREHIEQIRRIRREKLLRRKPPSE